MDYNNNYYDNTKDEILFTSYQPGVQIHSGLVHKDELIDDYMKFLSTAKTERLCVKEAVKIAESNGFKKYDNDADLKPGDKVYFTSRDKNFAAFIVGKNKSQTGFQLLGAHIDAPRIDVKQKPLYENTDIAYFDTQYYGGIKKYQWTTTPLAIYGVIYKMDGTRIDVSIGDNPNDPVFCITDLLPHLDRQSMSKKNAEDFIAGEKLDIIVGTLKKPDTEKDPVKARVLEWLEARYNVEEEDLCSAELEIVPAGNARFSGFDKSLIAGYAQDDRVCAYTSLRALVDISVIPDRTCGVVLVDKEEIGSTCASGAKSRWFEDILRCMARPKNETLFANILYNTNMLSSDVTSAFDPLYADAFDKKSSARFGKGIMLSKYNGGRGKSGGADANPEFIAYVRNVLNRGNNDYQFDSMGKVDVGGGGTIASIISALNINVLDAGVPILNMHSPMELAHVNDIYAAYRAYNSFALA